MTTLSRVRVEAVEGRRLKLHVDHVYGSHWPWCLASSRTLALQFLGESLQPGAHDRGQPWEELQRVIRSTHLYQTLEGRDCLDEQWNRTNAGRFVSCVGMIDRQNCDEMWADTTHPGWEDDPDAWETKPIPAATCLISVTDARLIAHLSPGMEWDSTAYNHDAKMPFSTAWRTPDVFALARGIEASQDFSGLPVLADALQEAGCDDAYVLNHLRDPQAAHVRGCWALDLVLGKE